MDLFSHALLPYLLGNLFKLKKDDVTALVLGGIAPDFDILILWINLVYPNFSLLITHRGITHSLIFGFVTGIAVLYLACRESIKNKVMRYVDFEPLFTSRTIAIACAGMLIHLFLDYVTTRGIPLLYPLTTKRFAAEVFFFTDTYLMIVSLVIAIILFKMPSQSKNSTKFLLIFIIVFAGMGALRIEEKSSTEQFFEVEVNAYPTMNPFTWYALAEDDDKISIFEYDGFDRTTKYNETVPRLNIISQGEGLEKALIIAGELPQVKMFKWRAYAVAVNASFSDRAWELEYYDPIREAMFLDSPSIFRRIAPPVKVKVEGGKAAVVE